MREKPTLRKLFLTHFQPLFFILYLSFVLLNEELKVIVDEIHSQSEPEFIVKFVVNLMLSPHYPHTVYQYFS